MPFRSAREAIEQRKRAVQLAASCVSTAVVREGGQYQSVDALRTIWLPDSPVRLRGELRLSLSIEQHYYVVRLPGSGTEWGIRVSGYAYALFLEERGEVLAFHWHGPYDRPFPGSPSAPETGSQYGFRSFGPRPCALRSRSSRGCSPPSDRGSRRASRTRRLVRRSRRHTSISLGRLCLVGSERNPKGSVRCGRSSEGGRRARPAGHYS